MSPLQMKTTVFFAANGFIMSMFAIATGIFFVYGPCLEPYIAGYVVAIPHPDQIWRGYITKRETLREVEVGCFRLHHLRKLAPAISPKYSFSVEARQSDPIPVSIYIADQSHQDMGTDVKVHPVGQVWDRSYCFEMPGTIGDEQRIVVSGQARHVRITFGRPFPFWKTTTPVPDFKMKPARCYAPDSVPSDAACRDDPSP